MRIKGLYVLVLCFCVIPVLYGQLPPPPHNSLFSFYLTPNFPSLVGDDHTFEGSILRLPNNDLLHLFRLDPGYLGNHVGNNGGIGKRVSKDNGITWSASEVIYNDQYDNRFSTAHILDNGDIIAFFRRYACYDTWNGINIDSDMIISKDNGETWSDRIYLHDIGPSGCYMNVFKIHGKSGYFASTYANAYIDLRYSADGYNWDSVYYKWDYRDSAHLQINEPYFASLGDGEVVGLFRVENRAIHQVVSNDFGETWSKPTPTNIANGFFCPAPTIMYNELYNKALIVVTDRRGSSYDLNNLNSGVWVYFSDIEQVTKKPLEYNSYKFLHRGFPDVFRMLGYPSTVETSDSTYLVLYSDAYKKPNSLEDADYYQFSIVINPSADKKTQTIYLEYFNEFVYEQLPYLPSYSVSSGLPVQLVSTDTSIVKISNNQMVFVGVGECQIIAYQYGNEHYFEANPQTQFVRVNKAKQNIQLSSLHSLRYGQNDVLLPMFSNKNLPITYQSSNPFVAEVLNGALQIKSSGYSELVATQEGSHFYEQISKTYLLYVDRAFQDIFIDDIPLLTYGVNYSNLPQTSSVGLDVHYEISDTTIVQIQNNELYAVGVGQCELTVQQFGSSLYYPIIKSETIIVDKAHQTIEFKALQMNIGDTVIIPQVIASSGLEITLTSSDTSIAKIINGVIYPKQIGACYITASQNGNNLYYAAQHEVQELFVPTIVDSVNNMKHTAYPNPTNGIVYITNAQGKRIELKALSGEVLFVSEHHNSDYIDISQFSDGVYSVTIIDADVVETLFVVLQH